jgi:hypothetical protein
VPTDSGRFVPWIAYSPPESVMARGPIGLRGEPPGSRRADSDCRPAPRPGSPGLPAGLPDRDLVAERPAVAENEVQAALARLDDDRAGLGPTVEGDRLPCLDGGGGSGDESERKDRADEGGIHDKRRRVAGAP